MGYVMFKIQALSPLEFSELTPVFVDLYLEAMGYQHEIRTSRIEAWRRDCLERGFRAICAHDDISALGIAYGFHGHPNQWWDKEVRRGLREVGGATGEQLRSLAHYFLVTEIHVDPQVQGHGIGRALLSALLTDVIPPVALLSTPEVPDEENNAFRLYRSFGFTDMLRHFYFRGDDRPFAVLQKQL